MTFTALGSIACPTATTCELSYLGPGAVPGILRIDGDTDNLAGNPVVDAHVHRRTSSPPL